MLVSEFDYHLPPERIAQNPAEPRDSARLMHVQTSAPLPQMIAHYIARDLPGLLRPDDLLIMNDTRVLRARLHGHKSTGGKVEALLLREIERNLWEVLLRPSARLKEGSEIIFPSDEIEVLGICEKRLDNTWHLRFKSTFAPPSFPRRRESSASAPLSDRSLSGAEGKSTFKHVANTGFPPSRE